MKTLGTNIRYLRLARNMQQDQLAKMLGFKTFTTIQKWETDLANPNLETVAKLAEIFGVTIDDLVNKDCSNLEDKKTRQEVTEMADMLIKDKQLQLLVETASDSSHSDVAAAYAVLLALKKKGE